MNATSNIHDSDCAGFYYWPPMWIGAPPVETASELSAALMNAVAFSGELSCGIRLKASKQALFVFDFGRWVPGSASLSKAPHHNWEERVFARMRFMNLFLACFYTAILRSAKRTTEKMFIDYSTYAAARSFTTDLGQLQCDMRTHYVIEAAQEWHAKYKDICDVVSEIIVGDAFALTEAAFSKDQDTSILAELLLHSFYLYDSGKYEASHIAAWTIAERCLHQRWETQLRALDAQHSTAGPEGKFINSERKQKLTGRDFTASIISEYLSLSGIISLERYKQISSVRQTRNEWLHKLRTIDRADAAKAIGVAQSLLRETGIIELEIPFNGIGVVHIAYVAE